MHPHIESVLWTDDQISRRISDLAAQISADFLACSPPPVFIGVATGAFLFLADLVRKIDLPITVDLIRAESYGSGTVSNEAPTISFGLKVDIKDRHVILVLFTIHPSSPLCFASIIQVKLSWICFTNHVNFFLLCAFFWFCSY